MICTNRLRVYSQTPALFQCEQHSLFIAVTYEEIWFNCLKVVELTNQHSGLRAFDPKPRILQNFIFCKNLPFLS